jgi:hypothetical protein
MKQHELTHLQSRVKELHQALAEVADGTDFEAFLGYTHQPGWTTLPEQMLVAALVEAMHSQTQTLAQLKSDLLEAAGSIVELNPQPLPP